MKNKQIVASWSKIKPSEAAEAHMLDTILAQNKLGKKVKKGYNGTDMYSWKRFISIAAGFILLVALVGMLGKNAGWFWSKSFTTQLENGNTVRFFKAGTAGRQASSEWDVDWGEHIDRVLTKEEMEKLFGSLEVSSSGAVFRSVDGALVHFEGTIRNKARITLSMNGQLVKDTVIGGNEKVSVLNDVPVAAGYFLTKANSKGVKTIIYFASFQTDSTSVYIELAGNEADSDSLRVEISKIIDSLTLHKPDPTGLTV